uniref:Uncharacterized protein n=1 Tax=Tanacetum cinerariifolium TaxID=118510 RepID=A0A699H6K4_TANCI|nr:hypothetical protein [Tanacetum cinerariifolium]
MTKSKSFNKSIKYKALYHALIELILEDKDAMDKVVAGELKKRKSNKAKHGDAEFDYADMPMDQGEDLGKTDEQPNDEVLPKNDWYKKSKRDTSPDPEWNKGKSVDDGPEQRPGYILLKGTCKSYVELDYTMEECYRALSKQLNWNKLKGHHCPYDLTKPLPVQMSSHGYQIILVDFFFNNDLEYLRGGSKGKKYTASTTNSKAIRYALLGIFYWGTKRRNFYGYITKKVSKHDVYSTKRILSIISVKVNEWYGYGYLEEIVVKRADQNYTLSRKARVEDLQLGLESYQKKLNLTKPRTRDVDMSRRPAYTTLLNPQGVIYKDKVKRKILMQADDLYKFSDNTLILVRDTLDQMLHELHLGYNIAMRRRL